ncbi:MAG: hypothetical protein ACR2RV_01095 [Verrucomicrobiales bacterium]
MKTIIGVLLLSLPLLALGFSQNQNRPRVVPNTARAQPRPPTPAPAPSQLEENISISLAGKFTEGAPTDVTLTGCGLQFRSEVIMGDREIAGQNIPIIGSLEYVVKEDDGIYLIQFSVGVRTPVPTSTVQKTSGPTSTSIGFEEVMLTGIAKCALDKEVAIFESGERRLVLKVTKPD